MKKHCDICDSCAADGIVSLATHRYDSDLRRNIVVCPACAEMVEELHKEHPNCFTLPAPDKNLNAL
jgi:hypothetical protein